MQNLEKGRARSSAGSVLVQVRMPAELAAQIDSLIDSGYFQGRTDFILESARSLLSRYFPENPVKRVMARALSNKSPPSSYTRILTDEERQRILSAYKGRDPLELSRWARERL